MTVRYLTNEGIPYTVTSEDLKRSVTRANECSYAYAALTLVQDPSMFFKEKCTLRNNIILKLANDTEAALTVLGYPAVVTIKVSTPASNIGTPDMSLVPFQGKVFVRVGETNVYEESSLEP